MHTRIGGFLLLGVVVVLAWPAAAFGHASIESSNPQDGAVVDAVPPKISMTFAEPPTSDSAVQVLDGCDRNVVASIEVLNSQIEVEINSIAHPGRWKVDVGVVSAVDAHATKESFSFRVEGEPDCSEPTSQPPTEAAGTPAPPEDDGGSIPWVPVLGGSLAVAGVTLIARMRSR